MRFELIALVAAASCAAAAPAYYRHSSDSNNDNYSSDKHSPSSQYYAPCPSHSKQPQTWWDDSGNQYGWDDNLNKACIINWKPSGDSYRKYNDDNDDSRYHKSSNAYLAATASSKPYGSSSKQTTEYSGGDNDYSPDDSDYSRGSDYSGGGNAYSPDNDYSSGKGYSGGNDYSNGNGYSGSDNGYSSNTDCSEATRHFKSTRSPTLIQCVSIACAPGQSKAYTARALYQCAALESSAKANNGGSLPKGW
ncbi:hypothetical protein HDU87_006931 [Geranomyces variabilis]|uniref:Uncharacterized protein n=1 Tax=Geranomyces variabilis TaxID=109894 RepID=A0AAD5XN70_9FUNG|nr:hypothetical protein HDU87_006931 [Geranomyces variabilis]